MRERSAAAAAIVMTVFWVAAGVAAAHETQTVGPLKLTVGWSGEPALAGAPNSIELAVTDTGGVAVSDPAASLTVDVTFGAEKVARPLTPTSAPGRFSADLIPTRAGTYAFRVHGTVKGTNIDITSTCSDRTFDCVKNPSDLQFPAKDPSPGDVAARLQRETSRIEKKASERDPLTFVALGLAVVALAVAGFATRRGAREA